uniref:Uncharacterized protein n=1 Tax=Romanomermis culicivorax TaxID=13658 RepID=A0A915KHX1_ROMCU
MVNIPIPAVAPLWEHPGSEMRRLSRRKQQLDVMFNLSNRQLAEDKKLLNSDKNNLMYVHVSVEAIRRLEHSPMMAQINTATADEFYLAISKMFEQTMPRAVVFYWLR